MVHVQVSKKEFVGASLGEHQGSEPHFQAPSFHRYHRFIQETEEVIERYTEYVSVPIKFSVAINKENLVGKLKLSRVRTNASRARIHFESAHQPLTQKAWPARRVPRRCIL